MPRRFEREGTSAPRWQILMVDTEQGRILQDAEIKAALAAEHPYLEWLEEPGNPQYDRFQDST